MQPLEPWIERQYRFAAAQMLTSISPLKIVKTRAGFGQQIRPLRGAIVASPVLGAYDPDPDYFFHWYRDSAVVIDALRLLAEAAPAGATRAALQAHFADFVHFSLALRDLDGRSLLAAPAWRAAVAEPFRRYLRPDAELAAVHGEAVAGETRVNPDGTLDISQWGRPQHDGPALRALALLRWSMPRAWDGELGASVSELLRADLGYTRRHAQQPCFDIWEEEHGLHYYTLRVAASALEQGADWLERGAQQAGVQQHGDLSEAQACRTQARAILSELDGYWHAREGYYRSRVLASGTRSAKELDIAVILAVLHAGGSASAGSAGAGGALGAHGVQDPRIQATLTRLEALFDAEYPINRGRSATCAPALGRYAADRYYSGGAYYFSTLAAAEFYYARAAAAAAAEALALIERGDAFLRTVRAFTPPGGELSEQFDQRSGVQTSAKHLAWSYAAFISCIGARRAAAGRH
ncbi:MAG: glycoside hydrolase family 15 protein [Steroidobacteraceae bacterium]